MSKKIEAIARELDRQIREGQPQLARHRLRQLEHRKFSRAEVALFAPIFRRAGLAKTGVAMLNPIVRPAGGRTSPASAAEKIEYATSLIAIGAGEEAQALLAEVDELRNPPVLLARAYAYVYQWDYEAALPLYRAYLPHCEKESYEKLVVETNFAAALVATSRFAEAEPMLDRLLVATEAGKHTPLLGASLQQSAQSAVLQRRWDLAQARLKRAAEFFSAGRRRAAQSFLVDKWAAYAELLRRGPQSRTLAQLEIIRGRAGEAGHWETLRECDRFQAIAEGNGELAARVFFGTPWPKYREKLLSDFKISDHYDWQIGAAGGKGRKLDLDRLGKTGQQKHRVLAALASDFYRPLRLATFHHLVYPREYFNPLSSPARMRNALSRLRRWFVQNRFPLLIAFEDGAYRLEASAPFILTLHRQAVRDRESGVVLQLRHHFGEREFTCQQAAESLNLSRSSLHRLLRELREKQGVSTVGQGPRQRYRLTGN